MEQFISIVAIALVGVAFWSISGLIADLVVPFILKRIRRRKKISGKNLKRCPMLECRDSGCVYYDKDCLICKFADCSDLLDLEVPGNE